MRKLYILLFLMTCFYSCSCLSQPRPYPIQNGTFRTDADMGYHNLTNVNHIIFKGDGTNVAVNASIFLNLFNGAAKTVVDQNNNTQYLFVSNGIPYVSTTNGTYTVILQNDTTFIRQGEYQAFVTNLTVYDELIIASADAMDDSQYNVTESYLTNGAISNLRIERFSLFVTNSVLTVKDNNNGLLYPLTN